VDNSLKYRRPEAPPAVRISARRFVTGDEAEIVYVDEGRGFPEGAGERIFQIGERLGEGGASGHGLGLPMCRAIAERHGGSIVAEGRPGAGATFRITLPLALHPLDG
jgi:signal transduction histidine kinase